jgi:predicted phosphodiesterase
VFATEQLDGMTDAALGWFARSAVDLILVLGDVVQIADIRDLEHMFSHLAAQNVAPLVAVNGNHDLRLGEEFAACASRHRIQLLYQEPVELGGVVVAGVGIGRGPKLPQYVGQAGDWESEAGIVVVASHFPLLSEASRVAGAGIPYAGDLVNRSDLQAELSSDARPKVVLSGHIHARCSTHHGPLLQFIVGALVEPPYDATIVDIDPAGLEVKRTSRRFGEIAALDPVFAADDESWLWDGGWAPMGLVGVGET